MNDQQPGRFSALVRSAKATTLSEEKSGHERIAAIKQAQEIRNVFCHGSWRTPDCDGRTMPLFGIKRNEIFDPPIVVGSLQQVQSHVAGVFLAAPRPG
ncbi:hypothetical protein [Halovulum marinum]|uniref:hypothetical protein n=1 Tax=Halovulum marinum TaxID=2662447 RepID=UPI0012B2E802|nr:hypothetical protein [Halovulum marinum]